MKTSWNAQFGNIVSSDCSIVCISCNALLVGAGPAVDVVCQACHSHSGIQYKDRVVCMDCACYSLEPGTVVTKASHPDGFTCADCGDTFDTSND